MQRRVTEPKQDRTTKYARDVLKGKITAGLFVRLACQRHMDDLVRLKKLGYSWNPERAEWAINFFPAVLSITDGTLIGKPFHLLPWHIFTVGSIFGWLDPEGLRRFRFVWLETGKGQAKSPLMAAIGILIAGFSGLKRSEAYCIGEIKDTARVMFKDAVAMVRADIPGRAEGESLVANGKALVRGTNDLAYKLEFPESGGVMQPIANVDTISGPKPNVVLGDEVHEMKSNHAIETWRAALDKRPGDPMMILGTNTPSTDQIIGTDYSIMVQKVLKGEYFDEKVFGYIARIDEGDKPFEDPTCWIKSLPALGITFPVSTVEARVNSSTIMLSTRTTTERLYFGVPIGQAGFWIDEDSWNAVHKGVIDPDDMVGRRAHAAIDLSKKNDLTALSVAWEPREEFPDEILSVKTWYYTCDHRIPERTTADRINYRDLETAGEITITPSRTIDYAFIAQQIKDLDAQQNLVQLVCDAAFIQDLMAAMDQIGFEHWLYCDPERPETFPDKKTGRDPDLPGLKIVRHAQGKRVVFEGKMLCMPVSIRKLKDGIINQELLIEEYKLTQICAANAVLDADPQDNEMFDKRRSLGRIDGIVTIAMAVGAAGAEVKEKAPAIDEFLKNPIRAGF